MRTSTALTFPREAVSVTTGEIMAYSGQTAAGEAIYVGYAQGDHLVLGWSEAHESAAIVEGKINFPSEAPVPAPAYTELPEWERVLLGYGA